MIDPLEQLEQQLTVEPSPRFAANVRMQVSARASNQWRRWAWVAAASTAAVAVAMVGKRPAGSDMDAPPVVATVSSASVEPAAAAAAPAPERPRVTVRRLTTAPVIAPREPEVIVSQAQLEGLAQLRARILDGTLTADLLPQDASERTALLPAPAERRQDDRPQPLDEGNRFVESARYSG